MNYYLILFLLIIILILLYLLNIIYHRYTFDNTDENILLDKPDENIQTITVDNNSDTVIPLNIFMTWGSKELPNNMRKSIEMVISKNSEFNFYFYNDEECRKFLKKYFIPDVVNAFDSLIPGAYKADLWRYCVLYKYGGIYQDIKYQPVDKFRYIELTDREYFVKDREIGGGGVYNALLVCKAGNEILYKCIKQIILNVKNKFYGESALEPTGPLLMKKFVSKEDLKHALVFNKINLNDYILKNNRKILKGYNDYRIEQKKTPKPHYSHLYKEKKIYAM